MDVELQKLVEAGKLTSKAAEQLEKLKPGTFCLHKSWGFGRVREWNLLLNQIVIDFASKKSHPMQTQYAAENLTPLAPEHFLARKATDLASIKNLARENPAALVRNILESLDGKATTQQIGEWLIGDVFTEAEWKRWWETTKKALKASGAFSIPAKKIDPIQIRGEGVSQADELIAAFNKARHPKEQIVALEQIIKSHQQFKEPEKQLQPIIANIFKHSDISVARDALRRLQLSPLFDELTKRSLLARIVKVYPELESVIAGVEAEEKAAPLIVSWSSLEKRKAEYEELVKVKIPENRREIALARSYGDLSENFEFKAAKQMQSVLTRRNAELEQRVHNARGTSFENPDTSRVSIGTIVTVRNAETNEEETYTILGAWDGDPDRHVISYQTAIGQALLGHEIGETVSLNTEHGTAQFTIASIQAAPPDQTTSAPDLPSESAVEAAVAE